MDGDVIHCPAEGEPLHGQDAQYAGPARNFRDNGNDTITDLNTTLMWQNSDDGIRNWQGSMDYCAVLTLGGYNDWRLPEVLELQSIVNYGRMTPSIDPVFFGAPVSYWSATTYTYTPSPAWVVDFGYGNVTTDSKVNRYSVRCVRGGRDAGTFDLTLILSGSGNGKVNFTPPAVECTTSCSKNYTSGTEVTLTAIADDFSSFNGWSGGECSGGGNCVMTVNQAKDVVATFTLTPYTLVYTAGANGSITGTTPQYVVPGSDGSPVTAVPNDNYHFAQWSDNSTDNPRTDTNVTAAINVTAGFEPDIHTLTYSSDQAGECSFITGTNPQYVSHGSSGSPVQVNVSPSCSHLVFDQWSDGSTDNPRTDVDVAGDITVNASFATIPE